MDPTQNTVVFQFRKDGVEHAAVTQVPTRTDNGIAQAWEAMRQGHNADPADVSALECEWKPSEQDQKFIGETFLNCTKVNYYFTRPTDPEQWDAAFIAARESIRARMEERFGEDAVAAADEAAKRAHEEAIREQVREAAAHQNRRRAAAAATQGTRTARGTADGSRSNGNLADRLRKIEAGCGRKLLPVILGTSSDRGKALLSFDFIIRKPLVPDRVFAVLAFAGLSPQGTVMLDWFGPSHHEELGDPPFDDLLDLAGENLRRGLIGKKYSSDGEHDLLLTFEREEHMASSLLATPDFYDVMSRELGAERLIVGIHSSEFLLVADATSVNADGVQGSTMEAGCDGDFIGPTVLLVDRTGMRVLDERHI